MPDLHWSVGYVHEELTHIGDHVIPHARARQQKRQHVACGLSHMLGCDVLTNTHLMYLLTSTILHSLRTCPQV